MSGTPSASDSEIELGFHVSKINAQVNEKEEANLT
jgi:hypothetical protein